MWYGSVQFTKKSRQQFVELSISLLKNFDKGNNSTLCNPSGPLACSALSSLPTRKSKLKLRKDYPFPFGINFSFPDVLVLMVASYHGFNFEGSSHFLEAMISFSSMNHQFFNTICIFCDLKKFPPPSPEEIPSYMVLYTVPMQLAISA